MKKDILIELTKLKIKYKLQIIGGIQSVKSKYYGSSINLT
jgi:hypothetical protein